MNRAYAAEAFCARGRALGPGCAESGMSRAAAWGEPGFAIRLCLPIFGLSTRAVCARANFLRKNEFGVFGVRACGRFLRVRTGRIAGGALRAKLWEDFALCAFASRFFDVSVRQKNDVRRARLWGAREVFLRPAKARIGEIGRCDFFRGWEFAGSARRVSRAEGARRARGERGESSKKNRSICRENSGNIETLRKWEQGL